LEELRPIPFEKVWRDLPDPQPQNRALLALLSGGVTTAPSYGKIGLTTHVSGILPVASGGTGISSGTSGGVTYFSGSTTIASSAALAANGIVYGGGAGSAPASSSATITPGGSISVPTAQTVDIAAHAVKAIEHLPAVAHAVGIDLGQRTQVFDARPPFSGPK
jgi:hypothetical protein